MISFNTFGGFARLGNQLFQLATILSLSKDNNDNYIISNFNYTNYFETCINIGYYNNPSFTYKEQNNKFTQITYNRDMNLDGYFQSEKYFLHNEEYIRSVISLKKEFESYLINKYDNIIKNSVSIHVRRGDYVNSGAFNQLFDTDYYKKSLDLVMSKVNIENINIFSDDITWCKNSLKIDYNVNINFIENEIDILELFLMSYCDHNIISNSSFSWWSSWLNKNDTKIIICPKKWFGDGRPDLTAEDLFTNKMILM